MGGNNFQKSRQMALTGITEKRIDSKGRLSIPVRMRRGVSPDETGEVIVLKLDGCLQIYPILDWVELQSRIEELSPFQQQTRRLQRLWGMNADQLAMDGEGRLTLTREQKEYADITGIVVLIGAINRIEIWSRDKWHDMMQDSKSLEELAENIDIRN